MYRQKHEIAPTFLNKTIAAAAKPIDGLRGQHLVAAANAEKPFTYSCTFAPNESCEFPGISYEIFQFIANYLGFTFTLVQPQDGEFGSIVNGNWTGLVGMLNRHEIDVTLSPLTYNYLRSDVMAFSFPIMYLRLRFRKRRFFELSAFLLILSLLHDTI